MFEDDALQFIQHPEGRVVADTEAGAPDPWEYQYFLKDHLGNTRVVFSEKKDMVEYTATLEDNTQANEMAEFSHYPSGGARSSLNVFDHTDSGTVFTHSMLLHGGNNSQVGLAKSFDVNPGEVFDLEVFAKYEEPTGTQASVDGLLTQLISAFSLGSATSPLDGAAAYSAFENIFQGGLPWIDEDLWDDTAPKAYLNYILFDENFIMVDFGFDQISTAGEQELPGPPVDHDYLSLHVKVQQKGYLYVYLSNEQPVQTNVYFDDMKIVHYSAVEQVSDYYPFGLTFNSYQRENSVDQRWKFQGQEHIDDLGLNWDSFKWRNYMPDIGRFFNVDPLADHYVYNSPYAFAENSVIRYRELEGLEKVDFMVAIYVPNRQPYGGYPNYNPNPTYNKNPRDVISNTADQYLGFRVDFENGNLTEAQSGDWDKNMFKGTWDAITTGDAFSLDHSIEVTGENGSYTVSGKMNDSSFEIEVTVDGDKITLNSGLKNIDEDKGGVIKATGANDKVKPSQADWFGEVINEKHKAEGQTNSSSRASYSFKIDRGQTTLKPEKEKK